MAVTLTTPNTILGVLEPKSQTTRLVSNIVIVAARHAADHARRQDQRADLAGAGDAAELCRRRSRRGLRLAHRHGDGRRLSARGRRRPAGLRRPTAGIAYLMGPTGGFLLGFLPMAFIIGRAADLGASGRSRGCCSSPCWSAMRCCLRSASSGSLTLGAGASWLDPVEPHRFGLRQGRAAVPDLGRVSRCCSRR